MFGASPGTVYLDQLSEAVLTFQAQGQSSTASVTSLYRVLQSNATFQGQNFAYTDSSTDSQFATYFINQLLGSTVTDAAKADGVTYVTNQLTAGKTRGEAIEITLNALAAVPVSDATYGKAASQLANKVSVAQYYTETLSGNSTVLSTLQGTVSTVNDTAASVTAANTANTSGGGAGSTFTLTTAIDTVPGASGNDTIVGTNTSLTTGDNINGGLGTDTLNVTMAGAAAPIVTLNGVENVNFTSAVATLGAPINGTNWTGVSKLGLSGLGVAFSDSVVGGATGNAFINLQNNVSLSLNNITTADNDAAIYVGFGSGKLGSTTATLALELNNVTGTTASTGSTDIVVDTAGTDKITKLSIASTGTNVVKLGDSGGAGDDGEISLTSITVTGAGATRFAVDGTDTVITSLATVDASAATGKFTADISASTKDVTFTGSSAANTITFGNGNNTITGGAGGDTFTLGTGANKVTAAAGDDTVVTAIANLTKADVIDLGDGTRDQIRYNDVTTLNVGGVDATALAALNAQKGVEVVGSSAAVTAVDAGYFTQTVFSLTAALTAAVTVTNVAGDTVAFTTGITAVDADSITASGALPNQTLTIELGGAAAVTLEATDGTATNTAITIASGISTVNLVSSTTASGTITNNIGIVGAAATATHVIDNVSAGSFVLTGATNLTIESGATAGFTKAVDFNASAFTGKLSIVGSVEADVIKGGSGADTINGHDGDDILTGNGGADTFVFISGHGSAAPSATVFETITDYTKASDIIDWDAALTVDTAAAAAIATVAQVNSEGIATFHAEDDTLAERIVAATKGMDADGDFVVFEFGTDTYVYISGDANATQDAADALIKLAGVTGITDTTIASGNLVLA